MGATIEQAAEYIRRRGSESDVARLRYLLEGEPVPDTIKRGLFTGQHLDGGWQPFWASDYRSLDATCFHLAQAEQMGVGADDDAIRRAVAFLLGRQRPDGWWEEGAAVAGQAPPWAAPGDRDARAYLTANCGFWVAVYGDNASERAAARRATQALTDEYSRAGEVPGFAHTTWLAMGLWRLAGQADLATALETQLTRQIQDDMPASSLTWLLSTLRLAGFAPGADMIRLAAARLVTRQRVDGGWPSVDGLGRETHVTLEAIRALLWIDGGAS